MAKDLLVAGIGEALWDIFPDGAKLGGAPANFAYHVSRFGIPSVAVSALGEGELGDRTEVELRKKMDIFMERVPYPTGTVQVSLDGTERVHDRIRGRGSFLRAAEGIDRLKARGVPVQVSFTAQHENRRSLPALALFCRAHGVDKLWFDRVVIPAEEDTGHLSLSGEEFRQLVRTARRLERFTPLRCVRSLQFADDAESGLYHCCAGGSLLILLADGTLMPCRRLPDVIGNIFDGELKDTLQNSETMRALRDAPIPAACAGCAHAERCRGGAKCITCAKTGSWEGRDPDCWH